MKICKKCGNSFNSTIRIDGKKRNLCGRLYCLECSPFKKHNTRKLDNPNPSDGQICKCTRCNRKYIFKHSQGHTRIYCNSCVSTLRKIKRKEKMVKILGGKCQLCGYDKCITALDFHHINGDDKQINIGGSYNRSWKSLSNEIKKCWLLCCRCHREIHAGLHINSELFVS